MIAYAHSPEFRLYLLSVRYLSLKELVLVIPRCSKTFYCVSWSVEYLKNAIKNALLQYFPGLSFQMVKERLLCDGVKLPKPTSKKAKRDEQVIGDIAVSDVYELRRICHYFARLR